MLLPGALAVGSTLGSGPVIRCVRNRVAARWQSVGPSSSLGSTLAASSQERRRVERCTVFGCPRPVDGRRWCVVQKTSSPAAPVSCLPGPGGEAGGSELGCSGRGRMSLSHCGSFVAESRSETLVALWKGWGWGLAPLALQHAHSFKALSCPALVRFPIALSSVRRSLVLAGLVHGAHVERHGQALPKLPT